MIKKLTTVIPLVLVVLLLGISSCAPKAGDTVTKEEYNALQAQLSAAQTKIAELQKAASVTATIPTTAPSTTNTAQINALQAQIKTLTDRADNLTRDNQALETQYADLNAKYQELKNTPAVTPAQPKAITEADVETGLLSMINAERLKAGVPVMVKGPYLYNTARQHSVSMAQTGKLEYLLDTTYQEIFRAVGYDSADAIARAALLTWELDQYRFAHGALLPGNTYGAVGAYKSGDFVYITFLGAFFP
jgi:TolA-binding protein